jgi:hypothetical protein
MFFSGLSVVAMFVNESHNESMQILGLSADEECLPSRMDLATDASSNGLET